MQQLQRKCLVEGGGELKGNNHVVPTTVQYSTHIVMYVRYCEGKSYSFCSFLAELLGLQVAYKLLLLLLFVVVVITVHT